MKKLRLQTILSYLLNAFIVRCNWALTFYQETALQKRQNREKKERENAGGAGRGDQSGSFWSCTGKVYIHSNKTPFPIYVIWQRAAVLLLLKGSTLRLDMAKVSGNSFCIPHQWEQIHASEKWPHLGRNSFLRQANKNFSKLFPFVKMRGNDGVYPYTLKV